jgi:predicted ATPase/DNA-binding winged helix-turn-helix (wHTH) protein
MYVDVIAGTEGARPGRSTMSPEMSPDEQNTASASSRPATVLADTRDSGIAFAFGRYRLFPAKRVLLAGDQPVELKSRAFEAALALVEAGGSLVTREQLHQRIWPDTFVEPHNLDQQISTLRRALGEDRDLIRTEIGRGWRLAAVVSMIPGTPTAEPPTNLPSVVVPLVGREKELSELHSLITKQRLVTLTGAGGIGKTQLGIGAARLLRHSFPDGVWVVELAPLMDSELVPSAIARTLGITPGSNRSLVDQVVAVLHRKHLLLVIDNCEHLIEAVARATEAVLRGAELVHVVATSQEPLEAEGEHIFRVSALDVPPTDVTDVDKALEHSAVQLFVERARAADRSFALQGPTVLAVSKLCRHLDGIPLAIELAAGCVATIGVETLADRLADRFRLLKGGRRSALNRHRTLEATLEWSYGLLSSSQQAVLRRLSVFAGSFTLDTACAVAQAGDLDASWVAEHLTELVKKSLIALDARRRASRYRLLDTTRAFALEKLARTGELGATARRHALFYQNLLEQAGTRWSATPAVELAATYGPEIDNIRLAITWAFEPGGDDEIGVALVVAAIPLWTLLSTLTECRPLILVALSRLNSNDSNYGRYGLVLQAALGRSTLWATRGNTLESRSAASAALQLAETLSDTEHQLRALFLLWLNHLNTGQYRLSLSIAKRFSDIAHQSRDLPAIMTGGRLEGVVLSYLGELAEAKNLFADVLDRAHSASDYAALHRSFIDRFGIDHCLSVRATMARVLWLQGFPDQAMTAAETSIKEAERLDHAFSLGLCLSFGACNVAALSGDLEALENFVRHLSYVADQHALGIWRSDSLAFKGWIAVRKGDYASALHLLATTLGDLQQNEVELHQTLFAGTMAQALAGIGRIADGLAIINRALAASMRCEGWWCVPELLRIKAALTLEQSLPGARDLAEKDLSESLALAQKQQAKSWELRVGIDLARLWHDDGHAGKARDLLAPIYDWFTEGFNTPDLKAARCLLETLLDGREERRL